MLRVLSYRGLAIRGHVPVNLVTMWLETLNVVVHIRHWLYSITLVILWLSKPSKLRRHWHSFRIRFVHCRLEDASVSDVVHEYMMTDSTTTGVETTSVSVTPLLNIVTTLEISVSVVLRLFT